MVWLVNYIAEKENSGKKVLRGFEALYFPY
jgi:hypothetical protein